MPLMTEPIPAPRVQAAFDELDRAAAEYTEAKRQYEEARVRFEAANKRFGSVRRLADGMLSTRDLMRWRQRHPQVRFAGMTVADAIESYLREHAYDAASAFASKETKSYQPWAALDTIVRELEEGGFQFRTTSPKREVNATVINLATVTKLKNAPAYKVADADEILQFFIPAPSAEPPQQLPEGTTVAVSS